MSTRTLFGATSIVAILLLALCASLTYARGGGGGGGGGHAGGGSHGGGGAAHAGGGFHAAGGAARAGGAYHAAGAYHATGGATHAASFAHASNFAGHPGNFAAHTGNFAGHPGNYAAHYGNNWGRYFAGGRGYGGWGNGRWGYGGWGYGGWGWGGYWPWFAGWGWGWNWGYPYANSSYYPYYYPDTSGYYYSYAPSDGGEYYASAPSAYASDYSYAYGPSGYGDSSAAANPFPAAPQQIAETPEAEPGLPADGQQGTDQALQYYSEARADFLRGDYQNALRLAGHAGVDEPQNPKVHESISLALFALGNYGPAASEAHAALALGPIAEWKDLYRYYNDVNKYTTQLRALEKAVAANPSSVAEHFLLGYHYLMTGGRDNARTQFAQAAKLTPGDKLAAHCLQELQTNSPLTSPHMAAKPPGQSL